MGLDTVMFLAFCVIYRTVNFKYILRDMEIVSFVTYLISHVKEWCNGTWLKFINSNDNELCYNDVIY